MTSPALPLRPPPIDVGHLYQRILGLADMGYFKDLLTSAPTSPSSSPPPPPSPSASIPESPLVSTPLLPPPPPPTPCTPADTRPPLSPLYTIHSRRSSSQPDIATVDNSGRHGACTACSCKTSTAIRLTPPSPAFSHLFGF